MVTAVMKLKDACFLEENYDQPRPHRKGKGNAKECSNYCTIALISHASQRRQWHPTPVLLPGKSHGWRSLVGCRPWGRKESNTTERLYFHFSLSCIGGRKWQPTPVFLPGESQGRGSLVSCHLWGHTESDTTEVT